MQLEESKDDWLSIKWWYLQNEMVIRAIWNYDTVFSAFCLNL